MGYKGKMNVKKEDIFFIIIISLTVMFLILFLIVLRDILRSMNENGNMFYVDIINFNMPVVKRVCFQQEDLSESNGGVLGGLLDTAALNPKTLNS